MSNTHSDLPQRIHIVDSHTAGEPTRCIIAGGPRLGTGPLAERLERMRCNHDVFRNAILLEPRGSDVLVGALLVEPHDPACSAGVLFFNNAGYLGMCGHGMIGVAATLRYLGQIGIGTYRIETPVGEVSISLAESGEVTIANVEAYRHRAKVPVEVPGHGVVYGDIAWGGNWFFLVEKHPFALSLDHVDALTDFTWKLRHALRMQGIAGVNGAEVDHIELFAAPHAPENNSRNFVLCPGKAYDRSPCGTGTSAKMACLVADGKLAPGQQWRQEGILGTVFTGSMIQTGERLIPTITSSAYITAESTLVFYPNDPFRSGILPPAQPA